MLSLKPNKTPYSWMDKNKISQRAVALLLIGAAAISLAPIFVRLSELGPSATAFYRYPLHCQFFSVGVLC